MREIRIAAFGLDRVGKTSLINRFLFDTFVQRYTETVEDIYEGDVVYCKQRFGITITDMGGYRQFPAMRKLAIQKSDGFLLVYSIDSLPSFQEVKRLHEIIVAVKGNIDVPILVVGNKIDIPLKRITRTDIMSTIKTWGKKVQQINTSAKNDENVDIAFHRLIELIDESKYEDVLVKDTIKHTTLYSIRTLISTLRVSFPSSAKKVHNVRLNSVVKKYRRRKSCSTSSECSEKISKNLLSLIVSPIAPAIMVKCRNLKEKIKKQSSFSCSR